MAPGPLSTLQSTQARPHLNPHPPRSRCDALRPARTPHTGAVARPRPAAWVLGRRVHATRTRAPSIVGLAVLQVALSRVGMSHDCRTPNQELRPSQEDRTKQKDEMTNEFHCAHSALALHELESSSKLVAVPHTTPARPLQFMQLARIPTTRTTRHNTSGAPGLHKWRYPKSRRVSHPNASSVSSRGGATMRLRSLSAFET